MSKPFTLWDTICGYAYTFPEKTFLSIGEHSLTYKEIRDKASALSQNLRKLGVESGNYTLIILPNSPEWYLSFLAISAIGAIPVPLDPQVGFWELENIQKQVSAKLCITCPSYRAVKHIENIEKLSIPFHQWIYTGEKESEYSGLHFHSQLNHSCQEERYEFSPTLMLASTSGTTGNPKIIEVEQENFLSSQNDMAQFLSISAEDVMLLGMPLYHQGGFGMGLQATLQGATLIYQEKFTPEIFLRTIETNKVTIVQLTPTVAKLLLSVPEFNSFDISSVRLAYFAGESLSDELARIFWEKHGIRVVNVVGSTETGTMVAWDSDTDTDKPPSFLKTLPFTDCKIDTISDSSDKTSGEIIIHTGCILKSYFNNPQESAHKIVVDEHGKKWFRTGDLGRQIDDKTIEYKGRLKNIIKRGANLVYPDELQDFYCSHPQIKDIYIAGETDIIIGEKIVAYIVPKDTTTTLTRGDILRFSRGNIAAYKVPDEIVVIPHIPINKGKIDVQSLKQHKGA